MSRGLNQKRFELGERASNLSYSLRRYWVDEFHFRHVPGFREGGRVLNLGGLRKRRRGVFRIDPYGFRVVHLNLSARSEPEVIGDGLDLPFLDESFDAVIMSELLEHVSDPRRVINEAARILKTGGKVLITAPFIFPVHADPHDFGRYTRTFYDQELEKAGLEPLVIEPQGHFLSVLADLGRDWLTHRKSRGYRDRVVNRMAAWAIFKIRIRAAGKDGQGKDSIPEYQKKYTTGFGIVALKK